jgi:vacuolar-type H+-ATPase subunit B/Vma2
MGRPMEVTVSPEMLGRTFNGIGQPIDEYSEPGEQSHGDCKTDR